MKTTMISLMCGCITNIVLDPVLIFGYGPFPEMGIEGAALATGIGQALTLTIYLVVYLATNSRAYPQAVHSPQQKDGNKAVLHWHSRNPESRASVSFDFGAQCDFGGIFRSVYSGFGNLLQIADICLSSSDGIVQDAPLIGYNYGAGEHQQVSRIFKIVLCIGGIIMVFGTVICLPLIPGQLMGLFTHRSDDSGRETALRIIRAGFIVSAVSVTSSGALEDLEETPPY